jgi:hypothetical protein
MGSTVNFATMGNGDDDNHYANILQTAQNPYDTGPIAPESRQNPAQGLSFLAWVRCALNPRPEKFSYSILIGRPELF